MEEVQEDKQVIIKNKIMNKIRFVVFLIGSILSLASCSSLKAQDKNGETLHTVKVLKIDSTSFDLYYFYTLKSLNTDSIYEVVVEKADQHLEIDSRVKMINVKDTCTVATFSIYTFKLRKDYSMRIGAEPIGFQKKDLKVVTINNYNGIYSTKNLYSVFYKR